MSSASPNKRRRHSSPTEEVDGGHDESSEDLAHKMDIDEDEVSSVDNNPSSKVELMHMLKSKQKELAYWEDQVHEGRRFKAHLERRLSEIAARRKKTQRELANVLQDLDASRAHAPIEGTMEVEDAMQVYGSLKKNIESFISQFVKSLQMPGELNLSSAELKGFAVYLQENLRYKGPSQFIGVISSLPSVPVHIILDILIRHLLYFMLERYIFNPFILGQPAETSDILSQIYKQVQAQEPPDKCARWRALAYRHVTEPLSSDFLAACVNRFHEKVIVILKGLENTGHIHRDFLDSWVTESTTVFQSTSEVQDRVQTMCLEAECGAWMPRYNRGFEADWMVDLDKREEEANSIYIGTSCAFVALKRDITASGDGDNHLVDVIPASVITDNWVPRQSED